jgi:hypothetical protein
VPFVQFVQFSTAPVMCAVVRLRALMARQAALLITNPPIRALSVAHSATEFNISPGKWNNSHLACGHCSY